MWDKSNEVRFSAGLISKVSRENILLFDSVQCWRKKDTCQNEAEQTAESSDVKKIALKNDKACWRNVQRTEGAPASDNARLHRAPTEDFFGSAGSAPVVDPM